MFSGHDSVITQEKRGTRLRNQCRKWRCHTEHPEPVAEAVMREMSEKYARALLMYDMT